MAQKKNFLDTAVLHPILLTLYPVLALWMLNSDQTPVVSISRAIFIAFLFWIISLGFSLVLFRNWVKAGIFTSLFMLLFLTYGHFYPYIDKVSFFGWMVGRHRFLIPGCFVLVALIGFFMLRSKTTPYGVNRILNIVSLGLFTFAAVQIGASMINTGLGQFAVDGVENKSKQPQVSAVDGPDVYYIVLDGYSRSDLLERLGGPVISGFQEELKKLGFQNVDCSQSNYDRTNLSLASSLNMNYLEQLGIEFSQGDTRTNAAGYEKLLKHSLVRQKFEEMGYQFVTFKAVYGWIDITDSDVYINSEEITPFYNRLEVINFQYLFLSTTMLRPVVEAHTVDPKAVERLPLFVLQLLYPKADLFSTREYKQYQQNLYALEKLSEAPGIPGKKFVYAHLFVTHQPYVFNADGSFRWPPKDDDLAYFAQIEYANKRIPQVLKKIIENSEQPPIIILQSDHGYSFEPDRVKIINSYFLPGDGDKNIYPEITPVNTFRMVMNEYFGGNYELLEDQSFHSPRDFPYQFENVPITCP